MNSQPASKETIDTLISNAAKAIEDLYVCIKKDIADKSLQDASVPSVYTRTFDVRIGIQFVIMDLGVSCRALFQCNNPFEKRHHMKNIHASISEGYKLLLGFGKARKHTLWSHLQSELIGLGNGELISEFSSITSRLDDFSGRCIDRDIRNLTLHYDDNMMKVFEKTVSINSEEVVTRYICEFWGILQDMLNLCNKVDKLLEANTQVAKPESPEVVSLNVNNLHSAIRNIIGQNGELEAIITNIIPKASHQLDSMADIARKVQRIREFVETKVPIASPFSELDNIEVLANNELLIRFMAIDLASVLNAYLHSASDIESSLNLRRVVVIKTSTLVHLYGYNEDEQRKSVWRSILSFVPSDNKELQENADEIENLLYKIITGAIDKDQRVALVHLYNNSEKKGDIESVMTEVETLDPLKQAAEIMLLLHVYKLIQSFSDQLMKVLADNAHRERLKSQKKVEDMADAILAKLDSHQVDPQFKKAIVETTNKIKNLLN